MKIIRIETGKVKVKENQISKVKSMAPKMTKVLFGRQWSDWLPIYAWLVEHPEGILVVDTGETYKTGMKGYLPSWHPYYSRAVKFDVKREDEIGLQLQKMGVNPRKDVKKVVMTHLHTDHAGGLHHFPQSEIIIERKEYKNARGVSGIMAGYLPHRWPKWLKPTLIKLEDHSFGPFGQSMPLTRDGSIHIVSTPGHVPTHISVVVKMDEIYYFLAGDTSYTQDNMLNGLPDGVGTDESRKTLQKIQQFSRQYPTVYLPSHDPESASRMDQQIIVPHYQQEVAYG
jgi:glyoxylase-like metal-dependent hydrolase (beta-lactamase superfamily II)